MCVGVCRCVYVHLFVCVRSPQLLCVFVVSFLFVCVVASVRLSVYVCVFLQSIVCTLGFFVCSSYDCVFLWVSPFRVFISPRTGTCLFYFSVVFRGGGCKGVFDFFV